jgi:precorrin-6B methylase 2
MKPHEVESVNQIPSWTTLMERAALGALAAGMPTGGLIVEIGGLYGGTTSVLALANPAARVVTIDEFSWSPAKDRPPASAAGLRAEMTRIGASNVTVMEGDSATIGPTWDEKIDLLFIDGGHSFEAVRADLENFAKHTRLIACHDWKNRAWPSVRQAIEAFILAHPEWTIVLVADTVVVLRRRDTDG